MQVCLRHESDSNAIDFTQCAFGDVEHIVVQLQSHGVYWQGGTYREMELQFVLGPMSAYAEIVLEGEPE